MQYNKYYVYNYKLKHYLVGGYDYCFCSACEAVCYFSMSFLHFCPVKVRGSPVQLEIHIHIINFIRDDAVINLNSRKMSIEY